MEDDLTGIFSLAINTEKPLSESGISVFVRSWLRGQDLNLQLSGYEPDEPLDCSTSRQSLVTVGLRDHQTEVSKGSLSCW